MKDAARVPSAPSPAVPFRQGALPDALPLDRQFAGRLARRYGGSPALSLLSLRVWQLNCLAETLAHANENSLLYRRLPEIAETAQACRSAALDAVKKARPLFDRASSPEPLKQENALSAALQESLTPLLQALPFTLPADLAAAPEAFLAVPHGDVAGLISLSTSGTTGPGKRIFCTEEDLAETAAFFKHGMRLMVDPARGDSLALLMSGERPGSVGDLLGRGMRALGVPFAVPGFVPCGAEAEDAYMDALITLAPTCLVGVPGQLLSLARHRRAGKLGRTLRTVLLSGDSATPALRAVIAQGFGCEVFVHYGLTETGLGGAVECREHAGCHLREADLLCEVVDEAGQPVPGGGWGEVALTTLTRQAMPLIRYRTGDEGRRLPGGCACGSLLGRIEVRGRLSDRLSLQDGNLLPVTALDAPLLSLPWVRGWQAALYRPPCLVVTPELAPEAPASARAVLERSLTALPGLRPIRTAQEQSKALEENRLPVLLHGRAAGEGEDSGESPARTQAKRTLRRNAGPVPASWYG